MVTLVLLDPVDSKGPLDIEEKEVYKDPLAMMVVMEVQAHEDHLVKTFISTIDKINSLYCNAMLLRGKIIFNILHQLMSLFSGLTGPSGKDGTPGLPGRTGQKGQVGNAGQPGSRGDPGEDGSDGEDGRTGPQGDAVSIGYIELYMED